jgi:hypothetical protein
VFEVWLAKPDGKGVSLKEDDRMALGVDGHVFSSVSLHENGDIHGFEQHFVRYLELPSK